MDDLGARDVSGRLDGRPSSPPGPSSCTITDAAPRGDVRAISRRFSDRLSGGTPHGDEPDESPTEGAPSGLRSNSAMTKGSGASTPPAAASSRRAAAFSNPVPTQPKKLSENAVSNTGNPRKTGVATVLG